MKPKILYIRIKEQHLFARIAAWKLGASGAMAITLGHTIYLHKVRTVEFLHNRPWLQHELTHVHQFRQWGFWTFLYRYIKESIRKGYHDNSYERAARNMEQKKFQIIGYYYIIT